MAALPRSSKSCIPSVRGQQSSCSRDRPNTYALKRFLGINSPLPNGVRYAVDGQHVSGDAVVHVVRLRVAHYIIEGADHDVCELFVHDRLFPEIALPILYPFEIGGCDASGIAEDVWNNEDFIVGQNVIGGSGRGTIGPFGQDAAFYAVGVLAGDLVLGCGGDQNLAFLQEELIGIGSFGFLKTSDRAIALTMVP